jgi:hypothetical protein
MLPLVLAEAVSGGDVGGIAVASPKGDEPKLRNGLVLGLTLGAGVGHGKGYPNNSQDIGDPNDLSSSAWIGGDSRTLVVMGALTDYLSFGFFLTSSSFRDSQHRMTGTGIGLRVDAFPLISLVPSLSGLGFFSQFGVGSGELENTSGAEAAKGTQSYIGVGVFHEWPFGHVLGGHFAAGPSVEYDAMWSRPFQETGLVAAARMVFYGGN